MAFFEGVTPRADSILYWLGPSYRSQILLELRIELDEFDAELDNAILNMFMVLFLTFIDGAFDPDP